MMAIAPTFAQIKAKVSDLRKKAPGAVAFGIHSVGPWTGEREILDGDDHYRITQCDSPLAMRLALRSTCPAGSIRVLISGIDASDVPRDVLVRLAKRGLHSIDRWQIVRALFQAHAIDTRVTRNAWMADQILLHATVDACPAAPGGFLDLETVWPFLLERALGIAASRPDLPYLLKWSMNEAYVAGFRAISPDFRDAAIDWMAQGAGAAAGIALQCVERSDSANALAVGLAAAVVFHPQAEQKLEKAIGRMEERYLGGHESAREPMRAWGDAAQEVVRLQLPGREDVDAVLKQSDRILRDVQADAYAYLSDVSPLGFDQRLERFGAALSNVVSGASGEPLQPHYDNVRRHYRAGIESRRIDRLEMAMRLQRWLRHGGAQATTPGSFAEAVVAYVTDGSFVDTARLSLRNGDAVSALSEAYMALVRKSTIEQERQAKAFALLLRDWNNAGAQATGVIPVEEVIPRIVAPLSKEAPVLLIVMDGMSMAVFNHLIDEIAHTLRGSLLCRRGNPVPPIGIATIPSVTEFSRTSLLAGKRLAGNSSIEENEFAKHTELMGKTKGAKPPVLYHKAALHDQDDGGLSRTIRKTIASTEHRVVGFVINAIDDYLLKGEQIDMQWNLEEIKGLPALLHEARNANRTAIIVSDHGHILERTTTYRAFEGGDRWRVAAGAPEDTEIEIQGPRVLVEGGRTIVPWSEGVRYAGKKNGYHGGVSPQEMLIPVAVIAPESSIPEGWEAALWTRPGWWFDDSIAAPVTTAPVVAVKPKQEFTESLLDWREDELVEEEASDTLSVPPWIQGLLKSAAYGQQKSLVGRSYPKNEQTIVDTLAALDRSGGKLTTDALARAIDLPPIRLRGLLAVMQKLLNLDGYEVLGRDGESGMVELNVKLLNKQFELN